MAEKGFEVRHRSAVVTPEERAEIVKRHERIKRSTALSAIRTKRSVAKGKGEYKQDAPTGFTAPKAQVNFNVSTKGAITGERFPLGSGGAAYEDKKVAKNARKASKQKFIASRANQKSLAEKAKSRPANDMEQKLREHNRGLFAADVYHANLRAQANFKELNKSFMDPEKISGEHINKNHEGASSTNRRFEGLRPMAHAGSPSESEEVRAFAYRAKGAILPAPHPKSLSAKAKFSPKAKRDAWRAKAAAGTSPHSVETDLHASDRMNKTWNKVKAVVPGELPDID